MPLSNLHRSALLLALASFAGCSGDSTAISDRFEANGRESVDLVEAVPSQWDKACVIGPYMGDTHAEETLGFAWPVERRTRIEDDDGISLLVFVRGTSVVEYIEHPRSQGDFAGLAGRCFERDDARFKRAEGPPGSWPRLVQENEA